jgi:hypothetical protein
MMASAAASTPEASPHRAGSAGERSSAGVLPIRSPSHTSTSSAYQRAFRGQTCVQVEHVQGRIKRAHRTERS